MLKGSAGFPTPVLYVVSDGEIRINLVKFEDIVFSISALTNPFLLLPRPRMQKRSY